MRLSFNKKKPEKIISCLVLKNQKPIDDTGM